VCQTARRISAGDSSGSRSMPDRDKLETIGKKTYDVLAEDDDVLTVDAKLEKRPTLSQVAVGLRAKDSS
jgi:hypothetical protein